MFRSDTLLTLPTHKGLAATVAGALTGGTGAFIGRTVVSTGGRVIANAGVGATANATQALSLNAIDGPQGGSCRSIRHGGWTSLSSCQQNG